MILSGKSGTVTELSVLGTNVLILTGNSGTVTELSVLGTNVEVVL